MLSDHLRGSSLNAHTGLPIRYILLFGGRVYGLDFAAVESLKPEVFHIMCGCRIGKSLVDDGWQ